MVEFSFFHCQCTRACSPKLHREYDSLRTLTRCHGFPGVRRFWKNDMFNAIVMELLGPSLDDLHKQRGRRFSELTVAKIALQMIRRVETMHSMKLIHRDIKPDNFLVGLQGKEDVIHLVDFGLSRSYIDRSTGRHVAYKRNRGLIGTLRYISVVCVIVSLSLSVCLSVCLSVSFNSVHLPPPLSSPTMHRISTKELSHRVGMT